MEESKKLARDLADFVNKGCSTEEFISEFCKQHRTLQQSSLRLMLAVIEHIASSDYRTDGRNIGSHIIAKELLRGFKKLKAEEDGYYKEEDCPGPSKFLGFI